MGSLSNYLELKLLDHVLNNVAYTPAATIYLALCTADPTDAGTGATITEVANSGAYARKLVNPNGGASPTWDLAAGRSRLIRHILGWRTHGNVH